MLPPDSSGSSANAHLESLRGQVRAALLTKKRGEARQLLGQLVSLTRDPDAMENLKALIGGVSSEVTAYEAITGSIRERLAGVTTPAEIQRELDLKIPYWKVFLSDIPVLKIAIDGLADHDNPLILAKLTTLVEHMKAGRMEEALKLWKDLGEPTGAADGLTVQILESMGRIRGDLEKRNWSSASSSLRTLQQLQKSTAVAAYQPGLGEHVALQERDIGYETLLVRADACGAGRKERRTMLEELFAAKAGIDARSTSDPSLLPFKGRVDEAIETLGENGEQEAAGRSSGGGRFLLPVVIVILAGALIGYWFISGSGEADADETLSSNGSFDPQACGKPLPGDVQYPMPNNNFMLFRKVYLSDKSGVSRLKMTELDSSATMILAPFRDEDGRSYFLMGKSEVSVAQYSQFMPPDPSIKDQTGLPIRLVTADDAENFCMKYAVWLKDHANLPESMSGKFGQARLPYNAEWEFAARGGSPDSPLSLERFGAYPTKAIAEYEWFAGPESAQGKPRKIALLKANKLGLFDMLGNVSEIVTSERSDLRKHWMRGGNVTSSESSLTPATKQPMPDLMPNIASPFRQDSLGFRVVISTAAEWNDSAN